MILDAPIQLGVAAIIPITAALIWSIRRRA